MQHASGNVIPLQESMKDRTNVGEGAHAEGGNGLQVSYKLPAERGHLFEIEEEEHDAQAAALADVVIDHHVRLREKELNLKREAQLRAQRHAEKNPLAAVEAWKPDPKKYTGRSLGVLSIENIIRYACIYLVENGLDQAALILILANTALLALFDPLDTEDYRPESSRRSALNLGNQVCSLLFALECAIKIIAQGLFFGQNSFLRDGWGWMDLVIVIFGVLQDFVRQSWMQSISALRAVRILRPLRAVNKIPQLRLLVIFVARVIPTLNTVLFLVAFLFFVFAVVGTQFFQGTFRQRCYAHTTGLLLPSSPVCALFPAEGAQECPEGYQCLGIGMPPYRGVVTFDDVGLGMMTVMQVMTLEGWSDIMDTAQGATTSFTGLFFIFIVLMGPMFALKMFLAVIAHRLKDTQADTKRMSAAEIIRVLVRRDLLSFLELWREGVLIARVERSGAWTAFRARQVHRFFVEWERMRESRRMAERHRTAGVGISVLKKIGHPATVFNLKEGGAALKSGQVFRGDRILAINSVSVMDRDERGVYDLLLGPRGTRVTLTISAPLGAERRSAQRQENEEAKAAAEKAKKLKGWTKDTGAFSVTLRDLKPSEKESAEKDKNNAPPDPSGSEKPPSGEGAVQLRTSSGGFVRTESDGFERTGSGWSTAEGRSVTIPLIRDVLPMVLNEEAKQKEILRQRKEEQEFEENAVEIMSVFTGRKEERVPLRERLRQIASSERLADSVAIVIVLNTICLAMYHELDSQVGVQWTRAGKERDYYMYLMGLEAANLLFLVIFFLEFFVKIVGLGPMGYFYSATNIFDFLIVAAGAYEFPEVLSLAICYGSRDDPSTCTDSSTALTVLRCFRLARLVKFFRRFPSFQRQINRLVQMVKPVSTLGFLMVLFLTVYCILGMNLFGGQMYEPATWKDVGHGELVYVRIPDDTLPSYLPGRPGVVRDIDIEAHPSSPYKVSLVTSFTIFGDAAEDSLWCGLETTGPYMAGIGVPAIASKLPRANFDSFSASILTVFQVLTQTDWQYIMYNVATSTGPWSSIYFYSLLFFGNYVLLNMFVGIVVVGFGDSQGQLQIVHRENREIATRRMEGQLMLKEAVFKTISIEICNFPGPRCEVEGVSVWNMLPFRIDMVKTFDTATGRQITRAETNYDYVQIKSSVRRLSEILLGMLDLGALTIERSPTVSDIETMISELRHLKIATRKRWTGEEDVLVKADVEDARSKKKPPLTSTLFRVIPCLVEVTKGRYETYTYIAVEYFYRFWDGVENRKLKDVIDAVRKKPMTLMQMEQTMKAMIASKELKVMAQARLNAGEVRNDEIASLQLTFHDGSSRCQGFIGANTQCPNPLSCQEHRAVNQRFLHSFQVLKGNLEANKKEGPVDQKAKEVKLQHLQFAIQHIQESDDNVSGLGVPYNVCWYLTWSNPLRFYAGKIVRSKWFDRFVLLSILLSCASLMIERPDRPLQESEVMDWINFSLNFAFLLEAVLKIIWFGPKMYFRDAWNRIDFFIVVTGLVEMVLDALLETLNSSALVSFRVLRILRVLRALRPLRVVAQSSSLRAITSSLVGAVGPILQTVALSLIVFSVFGILGMQVLSGAMGYCTDPMMFERDKCVGEAIDATKRIWKQRTVNFNWLGDAVSAVYIVSSQDHWTERMNEGIDATSAETGPYRNNTGWLAVFYIFVIFVGGFFVISIFVGVFVQTFFTASTALDAMKPPPTKPSRLQLPSVFDDPKGFLTGRVFRIVSHPVFEGVIMFCITINVACLSLESYRIGHTANLVQETVNNISNLVFGAEALFKLFAFKPRYYFNDWYNTFDFFLVVTSFAGLALQEQAVSSTSIDPSLLRIVRAFRLFRVLRAVRIIRGARGLMVIGQILYNSLSVIFNLAALLMLIYYMFGVMGVGLFSHVCQQGDERIEGPNGMASRCALVAPPDLVSLNANFQNLGVALFTLFRVSTLDLWSESMLSFGLSRSQGGGRAPGALQTAEAALAAYGRSSVPSERQELLNQARGALPACQSIEELETLREAGVLYCDRVPCAETCGTIFSLVYFPVFVTLSSFVLMNLVTAVLLRELVKDKDEHRAMVTEYISLPRFHLFCRIWRRNARRKLQLQELYQGWLQGLVRRHLMSLAEFEVQIDDLFRALAGVPDEQILQAVDEACRLAEARSRKVAASLAGQVERLESVQEKAARQREAEERRRREACVSLEMVTDRPFKDPRGHGIRHQIRAQRLIRQDLAAVLQCPPSQIEVVGLYPGPSPKTTKVVVVLLPPKDAPSRLAGAAGAAAADGDHGAAARLMSARQRLSAQAPHEDEEPGSYRAAHNPHALLSELVFRLAQRPAGAVGGGIELMSAQCTVTWLKVLAQDAAVTEDAGPGPKSGNARGSRSPRRRSGAGGAEEEGGRASPLLARTAGGSPELPAPSRRQKQGTSRTAAADPAGEGPLQAVSAKMTLRRPPQRLDGEESEGEEGGRFPANALPLGAIAGEARGRRGGREGEGRAPGWGAALASEGVVAARAGDWRDDEVSEAESVATEDVTSLSVPEDATSASSLLSSARGSSRGQPGQGRSGGGRRSNATGGAWGAGAAPFADGGDAVGEVYGGDALARGEVHGVQAGARVQVQAPGPGRGAGRGPVGSSGSEPPARRELSSRLGGGRRRVERGRARGDPDSESNLNLNAAQPPPRAGTLGLGLGSEASPGPGGGGGGGALGGTRYLEAEGGALSLGRKSIHVRAAVYLDMVLSANQPEGARASGSESPRAQPWQRHRPQLDSDADAELEPGPPSSESSVVLGPPASQLAIESRARASESTPPSDSESPDLIAHHDLRRAAGGPGQHFKLPAAASSFSSFRRHRDGAPLAAPADPQTGPAARRAAGVVDPDSILLPFSDPSVLEGRLGETTLRLGAQALGQFDR